MFGNLSKIFHRYAKSPEMIRVWILIFFTLGIAILSIFFAAKAIVWLTTIALISNALFLTNLTFHFLGRLEGFKSRGHEFQSLIESVREGVFIYDANFKILQINKAAEEISQIEQQELLGKAIEPGLINNARYRTLVQLLYPSLAPSIFQISEAGAWPQIVNLILENPKREFRSVLHQVTDENGSQIGFLKLVKDVTREKAILQSKNEFINTAAHQLRTPLTAINWSLESIAKLVENQGEETKSLVTEVRKLSERTLKIANDLLDASKIEEGKFGYSFAEIDLIKTLKGAIEEMLALAKQYAIRVYFDPQGNDSLLVQADQNRLETAILNLLDNAIRYNVKNGKVIVRVERFAEKPFVKISVEDSGIGIYGDDLKKLFQKFYRGANAVQLEPNGNGLGLYITKNIVKRHGGDVGAESTINRGSIFWLTLPTDPELIPKKEVSYEETL